MNIARVMLLAVAMSAPTLAQSPTVLLQRGIFLEETAGDLDGAIKAYREILSFGANAHGYKIEARARIAECQSIKGAPPESRDFQLYTNRMVGFSITLPSGWSVHTRPPRQGEGSCADIREPGSEAIVTICAKGERIPAASIDEWLLVGQRAAMQKKSIPFPDFVMRQGSPAPGRLAGQHTLTVIGDYKRSLEPMTEWTTWVESETTRSSVVVNLPKRDFEDFHERFTPILNSYRIR